MTSAASRDGHATYAGVIVRGTGWDDETDAGHRRRFGGVFLPASRVAVDRRITPPTAATERRMIVSCHAAPQYSDADHAHLPGDTHLVPGFSRHGNVHVRLAD